MKRRAGVLLCGCGAYDGSDPQETILCMLALQESGFEVVPLAVDAAMFHVVDHATAQEDPESSRNMFTEAARLVRGKVYPLEEISPKLLDLLIIPGGQGAVKSLLRGFSPGEDRTLLPPVRDFILGVHQAGGALGCISLAEFVLSAAFGPWPEGKGCFDLHPDEVLVDGANRRALTPGQTVCTDLVELRAGIKNLVAALDAMAEQGTPSAK